MLKFIAGLGLGFAITCSAWGQHTYSFGRKYKVGQSDIYTIRLQFSAPPKQSALSMTMTQKVIKVYGNGDAEMKTWLSDVVDVTNGQRTKQTPAVPTTMRVTKFGEPPATAGNQGNAFLPMLSSLIGLRNTMVVGKDEVFESKDSATASQHLIGKITLVAVKNGIATLHLAADSRDKANHMICDYTLDLATCRMIKMTAATVPMNGKGLGMRVTLARKGA